ncbi:39S ribosomal protein L41, mitochondrial-like [Ostrea edulis]|uniref:39S ribosomal protein L41, mitochondrial-like n=1 Tax=Ostrea edulis TaxID=37623 RepID=UPI0024AF13C5|nr:39S ribosomal protein L41, mitochondrial-like [Ostrea edulis]
MNRNLLCIHCLRRSFSTTPQVYVQKPRLWPAKRSRRPFDERYPVSAKHVNDKRLGGSKELAKKMALHYVQPTGFVHMKYKRFFRVKEMTPELVVPDLTDCQLKPYVPYDTKAITQEKFTAQDLFNTCYAKDISEKFKEGEYVVENDELVKKPSSS